MEKQEEGTKQNEDLFLFDEEIRYLNTGAVDRAQLILDPGRFLLMANLSYSLVRRKTFLLFLK